MGSVGAYLPQLLLVILFTGSTFSTRRPCALHHMTLSSPSVPCRLVVFVRGTHGGWVIVLHGVLREYSDSHPVPYEADTCFQDHYVLGFRVRLYQPDRPLQQVEPGMLDLCMYLTRRWRLTHVLLSLFFRKTLPTPSSL